MKKTVLFLLLALTSITTYAQTTEVWTIKAPDTVRHTMGAAVASNIIYVIGGADSSFYMNANHAYNPTTNTWTTMAPMPTPRGELGVVAVSGMIYAIGGYNGSPLQTVEEYDPIANTWTTKSPMPTARSIFSVGVVGNNIYAIGGWPGGLTTVEEYNTLTDTWTTKASLPIGIEQINSCVAINGKLHLIGGKDGTGTIYYSTHEVYDSIADTWATDTSLPFPRFEGAATVLNNKIYYLGGTTGYYIPNYATNNYFDSATSTWIGRLQMLNKRVAMVSATVNGKIYVIDGDDSTGNPVNWNHEYWIDNNPLFTGGHTQSLTVCENASAVSINSFLAVDDIDTGQTETWSVLTAPLHGSVIASYTTTSTGITLTPTGLSYIPTGGYSGSDSFKINVTDGFVSDTTTIYITINPLPNAGTISGLTSVNAGSTILISDPATGGAWSVSNGNASISGGTVTGLLPGLDTVSYIVTNGCGADTATIAISVADTTSSVAIVQQNNDIMLYPNPATTALTISAPNKINQVTISNLLGQRVYSEVYNSETVVVNIADLPTGFYIVKINGVEVRKFVKE